MALIEIKNLTKKYKINTKVAKDLSNTEDKQIRNNTTKPNNIHKIKNKFINKNKLNLKKKTEILAVDNISFEIEQGEILGFIGPNGAGKSTTIKMLSGILTPTSGSIKINGLTPYKHRKKLSYIIGTVFGQKSQLWLHLPPLETFKLLGDIYDIPQNKLKRRIDFLIEQFDLKDILYQPVRKLSLGQRIKCEIAASLLHKPEILFLDEPTIGLDIIIKKSIRELIKSMNKNYGTTIILTSHDIADIEKLCKRIIIINHGKIIYDNTLNNLKYNFLNKKVISLKTSNNINLNIPEIKILKQKDFSAKIEVDTDKKPLKNIIDSLLEKNDILDINISDIPLEEVIEMIFKRKEKN